MKATIVFQKNWNAINARNPDGTRKHRYIINEGSSRSSKTISLMDCYDLYARSKESKRLTVWRDTKTDCKKTVLADMLKHHKRTNRYLIEYNFNKTESIFAYTTESTVEIHGTDDEETVHGLEQDAAWLNEPYKISRETFDQIDQRTSDFVFIDWNPKKSHWINELKEDERTLVIHSTFRDNPFCPEEQRRKILSYQPLQRCEAVESEILHIAEAREYDIRQNKAKLSEKQLKELIRCRQNHDKNSANEFNWDVYGLGLKAENPYRIFNFESISEQRFHDLHSPIYYGVDWGAVDPMGILALKYYDGAVYVHELSYASENEIKQNLTLTEQMQWQEEDEGFIKWYFNKLSLDKSRAIICDNNRISKIIALREHGYDYAIAARKYKGSIIDGIDLVNSLKVYYTNSSKNLEYEQFNYQRKVDRYGIVMDEPIDTDNHLMDPLRYVCQFLQDEGIIRIIA